MTENEMRELAIVLEQAREKACNTAGSMNNGFGMWYAQELAKADYCKIPDGAVVLSKEMYDEMRSKPNVVHIDITKDIRKEFESELKQARKETIKEVANYLDKEKGFCGLGYMTAKHFGVEVQDDE